MRIQLKGDYLVAFLLLLSPRFMQATLGVSASIANAGGIQNEGSIIAGGSVTLHGLSQFMIARYTPFGSIDTTYGYNGYVATPIGSSAVANALVAQSNGQVIVAGLADLAVGNTFALARYDQQGVLDSSFNSTGMVTKSIGTGACANSLVIDRSGKYVVAGVSVIDGAPIITVVRYHSNGSIDSHFGNNGVAIKRIYGSAGAHDVGLQSFGNIVTAGFAINSGTREFALARFTTNGSLDTTFGSGGTRVTPIGADAFANALAIQINDYIVAAGVGNNRFALVRYLPNGLPDSLFGHAGIVTTAIGSNSQINDVILQSNGNIIAVGSSDNKFALARYNTDGMLDTTFGNAGIVTTSIGNSASANSVTVQNNGQIIVAGNSDTGVVIVRYNSNGSIDTSFGINGIVNFPSTYNAPDIFGISDINIADDAEIEYHKLNLNNSIMDSDINSGAAIANSKLAPLASAGTVLNAATTATSFDVPGAIVARDTFGNFNANMIFSDVMGNIIGSASENLLKSGDTMSGPLVLPGGSTIVPSLQFEGNKKTGLSANANSLSISTQGLERILIDENGSVMVNAPNSGAALTASGQMVIVGDISCSGNSSFNNDALTLNAIGSTQGPLMKIYGGVGNTGLQGSVIIDYTAAGFSNVPIICMNPLSGASVLLTVRAITSTSAIIASGSTLSVPFNYIALGI